jgi:hypothetical protein
MSQPLKEGSMAGLLEFTVRFGTQDEGSPHSKAA